MSRAESRAGSGHEVTVGRGPTRAQAGARRGRRRVCSGRDLARVARKVLALQWGQWTIHGHGSLRTWGGGETGALGERVGLSQEGEEWACGSRTWRVSTLAALLSTGSACAEGTGKASEVHARSLGSGVVLIDPVGWWWCAVLLYLC